ncbi:putative RING-H2 finger protein ATL50 [Oryza brachyantha]|uniref:putative RING-H2 finger protein ATL50 n=1 Tax=Oryza brachyantha TaxID=4533 RepID=UPI001AD9C892|nr:putative RING-H2 finger protein ATL50 [Oryza brachyantha]
MGFPLVCYCMAIPKPLVAFVGLLFAVKEALQLMLFVVGICHHPERSGRPAVDGPLPDEVKDRLPPLEFAQLAAERRCSGDAAAAGCIVCLETLEATDVVRRLGNCAHAFHRGCIDKWIDLGRLTCPLCRASLLPRARAVGPRGGGGGGRRGRLTGIVW